MCNTFEKQRNSQDVRLKFGIRFLFTLICSAAVYSQSKEIDSLKLLLTKSSSKVEQAEILYSIGKKFMVINIDSYAFYSQKGLQISKHLPSKNRLPEFYNALGLSSYYQRKIDSARNYLDSAIMYVNQKDPVLKARILNNISMTYENTIDFENKVQYLIEAIQLVENIDEEVCLLYANLGINYVHAGFLEKAEEYYWKSYEASKRAENYRVFNGVIAAMVELKLHEGEVEEAEKLIGEAIAICQITKNPQHCYDAYAMMGSTLTEQGKFDDANQYLIKAKEFASQLNIQGQIIAVLASLAENEIARGNLKKASNYFEIFDAEFQKEPRPTLGMNSYKIWSDNEERLGNNLKSLNLLKKHIEIKDSLLNKEKRTIIAELEEKYNSEKKEREIAEQQVLIAEQELSLAKNQRQLALWGGLGGALAILLAVSFWLNKERQKRKEQEITNLKNQQEIIRLESLVSGEEKERVRLAQDLHDGINGDLSVIKFKVDSLNRKKLNKGESETVENTLGMLDNAIDQVRRISHNLAPPSLQNFNLNEAITQHLGKIQLANKVTIDFQTFGEQPNFSVEQETAIYRIVQELLNNIVKHAEATETLVQLNHTVDFTELVIEDNGKGFDTKISKNGIGLQNIASRVAFLKGDLNIESSGEGSTFTITLPKSSFA